MSPDPDLRARVSALLARNRVDAAGARYTRPARGTYPHQWLWDSCFHAILHAELGDAELARDELRALFRAQEPAGYDRGRLPHMTFFGASEAEAAQDPGAAAAHARDVALWKRPRASTITQPPIVAEAVRRVGAAPFFEEMWPGLAAYYDWWLRRRDPDGDGLFAAWHLWECGADATPRGDPACARLLATGRVASSIRNKTINPTAKKREDLLNARFLMLEDLQEIDDDEAAARVGEAEAQRRRTALYGHEAVDLQAWLVQNLVDLAAIGEEIGKASDARRYREASQAIARAVNERLWDESIGFYFDRWGEEEELVRVLTPSAFVPLYAADLVPRARAERLLAHLTDERTFATRWPVPTVARSSEVFDADEYWRGSSWVNVNWFVVRGLVASARRFGDVRYLEVGRTIAERTVALVADVGFREYYRSGAARPEDDAGLAPMGFGPEDFAWSGLVLDLETLLRTELRPGTERA